MEVWLGGMSCRSSEVGRKMYNLFVEVGVSKDFFCAAGLKAEINKGRRNLFITLRKEFWIFMKTSSTFRFSLIYRIFERTL
jgi:hypothetical protein